MGWRLPLNGASLQTHCHRPHTLIKMCEHDSVSLSLRTSLLLAPSFACILLCRSLLTSDNFTQHHNTVAVHEGYTRETLAVLECVGNKWLLGLEAALCHLVGLECMRVLHLLATGLLAHLPLEGGDTAGGAPTSDKANRRIANLDFIGDVQDLDLSSKLPCLAECGVLLVDHDITRARHIVLVQTLDVETHIVTGLRKVAH